MSNKFFAVWCVVMALAILMGVCACASAETYAMTTVVVSVDYNTDTVEVEDFNGNIWAFNGYEDWQVFDVCSLVMDDNDTVIIYDDVIMSMRYNGWLKGWTERVCN